MTTTVFKSTGTWAPGPTATGPKGHLGFATKGTVVPPKPKPTGLVVVTLFG